MTTEETTVSVKPLGTHAAIVTLADGREVWVFDRNNRVDVEFYAAGEEYVTQEVSFRSQEAK